MAITTEEKIEILNLVLKLIREGDTETAMLNLVLLRDNLELSRLINKT